MLSWLLLECAQKMKVMAGPVTLPGQLERRERSIVGTAGTPMRCSLLGDLHRQLQEIQASQVRMPLSRRALPRLTSTILAADSSQSHLLVLVVHQLVQHIGGQRGQLRAASGALDGGVGHLRRERWRGGVQGAGQQWSCKCSGPMAAAAPPTGRVRR